MVFELDAVYANALQSNVTNPPSCGVIGTDTRVAVAPAVKTLFTQSFNNETFITLCPNSVLSNS